MRFIKAEHEEMETTGTYRVPQEEKSTFREAKASVILSKKAHMYTCPRMVSKIELWMLLPAHLDEQHTMSSHDSQSALMLTVEFSKRQTVPTLSLNNKYWY